MTHQHSSIKTNFFNSLSQIFFESLLCDTLNTILFHPIYYATGNHPSFIAIVIIIIRFIIDSFLFFLSDGLTTQESKSMFWLWSNNNNNFKEAQRILQNGSNNKSSVATSSSSSLPSSPSLPIKSSFRIFTALIDYSQDALFELLLFLSPVDACRLAATCQNLRTIANDEKLWIIYCKTRIEGFREYIQTNDQLNAIKLLLQFPNYRRLYQSLQSLKFPLFGWFRLLPQDLMGNCQGGLYCIYPIQGKVICQYVDYLGQGHMDDRSTHISYDQNNNQVISRSFISSKVYFTRFNDALDLIHHHSPEKMSLQPLPPILSPTIAHNAKNFENFFSCIGLFTSRYGSHGVEILHVSLHSTEDSTALRYNNYQFGGLQLQALKITGDRNVPAGKLSFCIDLLNTVDLTIPFVQDTRPIIIFPPDRVNPVVTNWQQRIPVMQFCARGLGQINRVPGVWNPEWVRCGFVLYKMPIGEQRAMFSIIWDDENDNFRHAMDFCVLPDGNLSQIEKVSPDIRP